MIRLRRDICSCTRYQVRRRRVPLRARAKAADGGEAQAHGGQDGIDAHHHSPGQADQQHQGQGVQQHGLDEDAHPFQVEHAARDEVAGMHAVVERRTADAGAD